MTDSQEYDYEISAAGVIRDKDVEARETKSLAPAASEASGGAGESGQNVLNPEEARAIAAEHAGFSQAQVSFQKTKLEEDDGRMVYELEFFQGSTEYEVTLDADTGAVLEYDYEEDDD